MPPIRACPARSVGWSGMERDCDAARMDSVILKFYIYTLFHDNYTRSPALCKEKEGQCVTMLRRAVVVARLTASLPRRRGSSIRRRLLLFASGRPAAICLCTAFAARDRGQRGWFCASSPVLCSLSRITVGDGVLDVPFAPRLFAARFFSSRLALLSVGATIIKRFRRGFAPAKTLTRRSESEPSPRPSALKARAIRASNSAETCFRRII